MQKIIAYFVMRRVSSWRRDPAKFQQKVFRRMLKKLTSTSFGKDHGLNPHMTMAEFQAAVPVYQYEDYELKYIPLLKKGGRDILWPGTMECFCLSSGTTSGEKLIPMYNSTIFAFVKTTFIFGYVFMDFSKIYHLFHKKIFHLYGLGVIKIIDQIKYGYLGHLANSKVPQVIIKSKYPPAHINNQKTWKDKIEKIAADIIYQDISVVSGTPPWMNSFLQEFNEQHHKTFKDAFPNFQLYVHGGCPFENYRAEFFRHVGESDDIWTQEVYPASEGYIAFQDNWDPQNKTSQKDMLLNVDSNIFFEFLPFKDGAYDSTKRLTVSSVEVGQVYTLVLTTVGCFISYIIGDNVEVTSVKPLRIKFAGRAKQNVNLVGEHMDFRTISLVFNDVKTMMPFTIYDYVLLPTVKDGLAYYHWVFAVDNEVKSSVEVIDTVIRAVNQASKERNPFYKSWFTAKVLRPEQVTLVKDNAFLHYLNQKQSVGQNKVPNVLTGKSAQIDLLQFLEKEQSIT